MSSLFISDKRLPITSTARAKKSIYPMLPICIRIRITISPKKEKNPPMSTTNNPDPEIAEVAIKIESMKGNRSSPSAEIGSVRRDAPIVMNIK